MTRKEFIDELIGLRTHLHEGAHFIASAAHNVHSQPDVFEEPRYRPETNSVAVGECRLDPLARLTGAQISEIGWIGIIAEWLFGVTLFEVPWPLTKWTVDVCYHVAMLNLGKLSKSDQQMIMQGHPDTLGSFRAAFELARKNKLKILRLARLMAKTRASRQSQRNVDVFMLQLQPPQPDQRTLALAHAPFVREHLATLPPGHWDRPALEKALDYLERGTFPPPALFERTAPANGDVASENPPTSEFSRPTP